MSKLEEAKQNLSEIIKLIEPELNKNDKNVTAILDLKDLKSLSLVVEELNNSIPKQYIQEKIEELKDRLKYYEGLKSKLPEIDENGVKTGLIVDETIMVLRAKIQILQEIMEGK